MQKLMQTMKQKRFMIYLARDSRWGANRTLRAVLVRLGGLNKPFGRTLAAPLALQLIG
jgi:hypothetical protein